MYFTEINYWAVFVCIFVQQGIEVLWFSERAFGKTWAKELQLDVKSVFRKEEKGGMVISLVLSMGVAFVLSVLMQTQNIQGLVGGALVGLLAGGLVALAQGINYIYERRSIRFYLITIGYPLCAYSIVGSILGFWR